MGINILINAGQDKASSSVEATGSIQHIITDDEIKTFKLDEKQLKKAIMSYFGKNPTNAYLKSPTPWNDLYKTYDWKQVEMILAVKSAKIHSIESKPVIIANKEAKNTSSVRGTFKFEISQEIEHSVKSSWSTGGKLSISHTETVGGQIKPVGVGIGGDFETTLSYEQEWGIGGEKIKKEMIGSTDSISVDLDPGQSIIAELCASRGTIHVRIEYEAYLKGVTAVNYKDSYKGHHFWGLNIIRVMTSGGISNSVKRTEDLYLDYYFDSKILLKDNNTNALIETYNLADTPGT